ncbi:MAG: RNA-binding S4 domain-containing protein [Oscillospiraceae bacterium]|nr:RNA-binding S4 domain-containing protein [Oscillospiraceae bacterium]
MENKEIIFIETEFIRLQDLLKFSGMTDTGGQAKYLIQDGYVMVNGEVCTMRGKKLRSGDSVTLDNKTLEVRNY